MSPKLARPIGLCVALTAPALVLHLTGVHLPASQAQDQGGDSERDA